MRLADPISSPLNGQRARPGKPAGEAYIAILQAAHAIRQERAESGQGATLRELAHRACVGYKVARQTVGNLRRRNQLKEVGTRLVDYRPRPVNEYAPVAGSVKEFETTGYAALHQIITGWSR